MTRRSFLSRSAAAVAAVVAPAVPVTPKSARLPDWHGLTVTPNPLFAGPIEGWDSVDYRELACAS